MVKELYIAGEWRLGRGKVIQSIFPADNSVNAEISTASPEDIEEAILVIHNLGVTSKMIDIPHESILYGSLELNAFSTVILKINPDLIEDYI